MPHWYMESATILHSRALAAILPTTPKSTWGFPGCPIADRVLSISFFAAGWPDAYATSILASAPTSMGLSFSLGAFAHVYFFSGSYAVYSGSVSPTTGFRGFAPLYQLREVCSVTSSGFASCTAGKSSANIAPLGKSLFLGSKDASSKTPQARKFPCPLPTPA